MSRNSRAGTATNDTNQAIRISNPVTSGKPPRKLDERNQKLLEELLKTVPLTRKIKLLAIADDQEAFQFARQIREYLLVRGWRTDRTIETLSVSHSLNGTILAVNEYDNNVIDIIVGLNQ
jgi:hypothetical protein